MTGIVDNKFIKNDKVLLSFVEKDIEQFQEYAHELALRAYFLSRHQARLLNVSEQAYNLVTKVLNEDDLTRDDFNNFACEMVNNDICEMLIELINKLHYIQHFDSISISQMLCDKITCYPTESLEGMSVADIDWDELSVLS